MTNHSGPGRTTVAGVTEALDRRYPPGWADDWDRVGLVVGEPGSAVDTVLLAIDCVPATVEQAIELGAQLMIVHHPLLLRGVHSVATTTYKGTAIHQLIRAGVSLFVAHTNADVANPGVGDALAYRLGLTGVEPLVAEGRHPGRVGELERPMSMAELTAHVAAALPATATGVRASGDPRQMVRTLAVVGGAGDAFLGDARAAGVDAFLTADLRHHPASEHLSDGGPALLDVAHWASERPWLDLVADDLRTEFGVAVVASDVVTDVWTVREPAYPQ